MKEREERIAAVGALLLVAAGVTARLAFHEIPNFAPVAGLALFAGYILPSLWLAALVPLGIMLVSDQVLGGYEPLVQLTVYACLTLPICFRRPLRRWAAQPAESVRVLIGRTMGLAGLTFGCSLAFFLLTNAAVWLAGGWYPRTLDGLTNCYVNALPFFRYTAIGDLLFASGLFSACSAWQAMPRSSRWRKTWSTAGVAGGHRTEGR